jgi:lactate permease
VGRSSDALFHQILTPIQGSLPLSFVGATVPIVTVLVMLGVLRRSAWQAALAGLIVGTLTAAGLWHFPARLTLAAAANGAAFGLIPLMWIVFNAILLYNVAVKSGSFDGFHDWILERLPNDRRVVLVVVGFCFGALIEGVAGFGTPVAITSSLLTLIGFLPLEAIVYALMFNTAPVAFSALGVPINVLAAVTHLPAPALAAMVGRQLPLFAFLLPFYVTAVYAGWRSVVSLWPMLLVAAGTFAVTQFVVSNFINYALTDVLASLGSLVATLLFLARWQPREDSRFAIRGSATMARVSQASTWHALAPWVIVSVTVLFWGTFAVFALGEIKVAWPLLHNAVAITLYGGRLYSAVWDFQPLGTGTAILVAAIVTAVLLRLPAAQLVDCAARTWQQTRLVSLTVIFMVALAYVMNYSGMTYTLGFGIASLGVLFVALSPFLGWIAVVLSGSDTAGNALFGNLQVVAANQLQLDPFLFAATNSSGGVMGKMISPENIAAGSSVVQARGGEGAVFARTFPHSLILTATLAAVVAVQQFLTPWVIPH